MDFSYLSAHSYNLTKNCTGNCSSEEVTFSGLTVSSNPYDEFFKYAFGSAIYIIIVSLITIIANGLLLLVFIFDPLKTFRNPTTYFLIGLAIVDILTAATQEPIYASCFIMGYTKHPNAKTCPSLLDVGQTISVAAMNASFLIVLAFTITQYIVVISPLKHARKVTKTRVIICVSAIYAYAILFSLLPKMGVSENIQLKIDTIFHSIVLSYLTIIFYILLYASFNKKMAVSKSLREDNNSQPGSRQKRQIGVERSFVIVNFLLIAILFFCSQPAAMLWLVRLYSQEDPNSPKVLIVNLMVDNLLYLKFMLDPFVYAWRIPKYRRALKIVLSCCRKDRESSSNFTGIETIGMNKSADTVITLNYKSIPVD